MQTSQFPPAVVYLCDFFSFFFNCSRSPLLQSLSQLCWHLITSLSVPQNPSQIRAQRYLHTPSILKFSFWQSDRQEGNAITEPAPASWPRGAACVHVRGMCACDKVPCFICTFVEQKFAQKNKQKKKKRVHSVN